MGPLTTVARVDLERYSGWWYEIARTPNRFENGCVGNVKVYYNQRPDGKFGVHNECLKKDGGKEISNAYAKAADGTNSKLRVTFFWPFWADYWVIDLDEDYRYAVVGEPDRKYLWILSRTPAVDPELYRQIVQRIAEKGYDASKIVATRQEWAK